MKETTEKVYRCEHCNKSMLSKGAMSLHERMCNKNPKNLHKCFEFCQHLVKDKAELYWGEESNGFRSTFHCALNPGVEMYSYKMERTKYRKQYVERMQRMPLQCDKFRYMYDEEPIEFDDIFDF